MNTELLEIYSDYLLSSFGQTTATGLSNLLDGELSHDQVTRFLNWDDYDSKTLWQHVKKAVREVEREDGVLIFDDTIQEKPYTDENELVCWHFDHTKGRSVKGINILNCLYHAGGVALPVAFELVRKPYLYSDLATRKVKRKSEETKNEMLRRMLKTCRQNQLKYRYVLADSWFSAQENLTFVRESLGKHFVVALKSNRTLALSLEDKQQGRFIRIDQLPWTEQKPIQAWLKGLDFPVLLSRQIFTNKDGSTGILYLACSDLDCDQAAIEAFYQKRWKVEVFHKTLKSNAALAKSPTQRVRAQGNHVFLSIYAAYRLECLSIKHKLNHFALRAKLYLKAVRLAFDELQTLKCVR
jgi:DDE superfamily endonuclease